MSANKLGATILCCAVFAGGTPALAKAPAKIRTCAVYDTFANEAQYNVGTRIYKVKPLGKYEDQWHYARNVPKLVSEITFNWKVKPHQGIRFKCIR